jgi:superfamily II DNA or RNA helicase
VQAASGRGARILPLFSHIDWLSFHPAAKNNWRFFHPYMTRLEDLTQGSAVKGILPNQAVTVVNAKWHGSDVVELTYKDAQGRPDNTLLYRDNEPTLEMVSVGRAWSFDGDGALLRLASEAKRIRLAYLFDPVLAVHISLVEPLPHQITAVYESMLGRQPLRFLLADDPGAGKTIMAGLLIKELFIRGDLKRCLVVAPGSLVEQWQDELGGKFQMPFEILYREMIETARSGNPFEEHPLLIARLDHLARNEELQAKLGQTEWDLIICDEAHKMSASFFGGEVKYTKRYQLGQKLGQLCRHFLLMTATPHNGHEIDFQLFMALLDADRFEGKFRDGVHTSDTSDLMRRLVKEQLLKFDGTPLFPERLAYSVEYQLSEGEAALYKQVTEYVSEEMNRADRLEGGRGNVVGFALTVLQRRLASSPEAIYQSLKRRRERLERRLVEERLLKRGAEAEVAMAGDLTGIDADDLDELDDAPDAEVEETEQKLIDLASAARTISELEAEIATLKRLEETALAVRRGGVDRKWDELSKILQTVAPRLDEGGRLRKLIIFTEHRDTLRYLTDKILGVLGQPGAVVNIHGGMGREDRHKAEAAFKNDPDVKVLVATDAAGEGINLQRAHLMVNYDLPWNPNRLEQRFGRIHRIGQTEVCHLWNLVAVETREGHVFQTLLTKLEHERAALGGQVFDVLGKVFSEKPLRDLLIEAIRYGDRPDVRARLQRVVDEQFDHEHVRELIEERALARDSMDTSRVQAIREDMERYQARRLQPHFIAAFFLEAFRLLGGTIRERETARYEITHVPAAVRNRDRLIGAGVPVQPRYERVTFEKDLISVQDKPGPAEFICPGHPLLDSVIALVQENYRDLLKQGAVLIDTRPEAGQDARVLRVLAYLEHSIQDASTVGADGARRVVSRRLQFAEIDAAGQVRDAGWAPYLDYRPATAQEQTELPGVLGQDWLKHDVEAQVTGYAAAHLVLAHLKEVRERREALIQKTMAAVKARLLAEINFWDHRANELKDQELMGKVNARLNSGKARQRAEDLATRLQKRMAELEAERHLSPLPPVVVGGALVVPASLLAPAGDPNAADEDGLSPDERRKVDDLAMAKVLETERRLGREPRAMPHENPGYDVESRIPGTGKLLFIEVKGKVSGKPTVTISKTQILTGLNKPEDFVLALVLVKDGTAQEPVYIRRPFTQQLEFGVTSVNFNLPELLARGQAPV